MIKKLNAEDIFTELNENHPQYIRIAIYTDSSKITDFIYRKKACDVLPNESGTFTTNYPDSKDEYDTEDYKVRWGRVKYLKQNVETTPTKKLKSDLIELKRIKESFPELMVDSLKEILTEYKSVKIPETYVRTGVYKITKKISEVSYDSTTDRVLLDNEIDYKNQDIRKRFTIYLDVLEAVGIPADEISEIFRLYYDH